MSSVNTNSLGALIQIHRYRPLRYVDFFTILLPGLLAILCPFVYGLYLYYYGYTNFGPVAAKYWSWPWYILAIIAFIIFLPLSIYRLIIVRRYVALHQNGLYLKLAHRQTLIWDHLSGVSVSIINKHFLGVVSRTSYNATLFPNVGKPTRLDGTIENLPHLLTQIKAKLYPSLLPKLISEIESGKLLYFGKIAISQKELRISHKNYQDSVPWIQVSSIAIKSGYLLINLQDNETQKYHISDIPNPELLLEIIQTTIEK